MSHDHDHHHHDHEHHHDEHHDHSHGADCGHSHDVVYSKVVKANQKVASVLLRNAKTLALNFDQRQSLPHDCVATDGTTVICHVHDPVEVGDKLVSNTNEWVLITAAQEELFEVTRDQPEFERLLHIAGLSMWPVELVATGARLIASHECMHMLEHLNLRFTTMTAPIHEIAVPEIKHHDCCDHDHGHAHHGHAHDHNHDHQHGHQHGPDCGHDHDHKHS